MQLKLSVSHAAHILAQAEILHFQTIKDFFFNKVCIAEPIQSLDDVQKIMCQLQRSSFTSQVMSLKKCKASSSRLLAAFLIAAVQAACLHLEIPDDW